MPVNKRFQLFLFLMCSLFWVHPAISQSLNLGTPSISSFSPEEYMAGTQNWDIEISEKGIVYIANNEGLLRFDSERWTLFPQENNTIARSVAISDEGIYVGGQDELGIFEFGRDGKLNYRSLLDRIPEKERKLEDVWNLLVLDSSLYIQNLKELAQISAGEFNVLVESFDIEFLTKINQRLYFNHKERGIFYIDPGETMQLLEGSETLTAYRPADVLLDHEGMLLILTSEGGIYKMEKGSIRKWQTNADAYFVQNQITTACLLPNGHIAVGTRLGGVVIVDLTGRAQYLINKESGLQSNSINDLELDRWGNIWVASYYGIDRISMARAEHRIVPDGTLEGAVYDIEEWKGYWWFGTANGLYRLEKKDYYNPLEPMEFELVKNTTGQVWGLDIIDSQLFMAHHRGAFLVRPNGSAVRIGDFEGAWKFLPMEKDRIMAGAYDGLYTFEKTGNGWRASGKIPGYNESSRVMVRDKEGRIWISHPYRGVYRLVHEASADKVHVEKLSPEAGFETDKENYISDIFGCPYLCNTEGIFRYEFMNGKFIRDSLLTKRIGEKARVRKLIQSGNYIWYIADKQTGFVKEIDQGLESRIIHKSFVELSGMYVGGFENLYALDSVNQFICTNKGVLYHFENTALPLVDFQVYFSSVSLPTKDSILSATHFSGDRLPSLSSELNTLRFEFRTNGKTDEDLKGYSYILEGMEDSWSEFLPQDFKEYNNLHHGDYVFRLRAMDRTGWISEENRIAFTIEPPWYMTNLALAIYTMLTLGIFTALLVIPRKKFRKTTDRLKKKQIQTEAQMEAIKKEKLESEIAFKNQELATSTLHLLQKNKTLSNIRTELESLRKKTKDPAAKKQVKELMNLLRSDMRLEEDWEKFSFHFDQVHQDFIRKLKSKYPELTANDHQLCAYLKMNLSTKEIAPLLNISVRGVEISRYRLRKKLGLDRHTNLNEFMNSV